MSSQENAALYKMHKTSNAPVLLHRRGDHCFAVSLRRVLSEVVGGVEPELGEPLFGRVGGKLYGMPMKKSEFGRAPICEFCAHQFNCMGGRVPHTLKIEDLLPPTSREIIHQPEEGYPA